MADLEWKGIREEWEMRGLKGMGRGGIGREGNTREVKEGIGGTGKARPVAEMTMDEVRRSSAMLGFERMVLGIDEPAKGGQFHRRLQVLKLP